MKAILTSSRKRRVGPFRGRVVVSPDADGYGFVEPDRGGGEVLFRDRSVVSGFRLRVGESVRFALADGSFALEAVAVTRSQAGTEETLG